MNAWIVGLLAKIAGLFGQRNAVEPIGANMADAKFRATVDELAAEVSKVLGRPAKVSVDSPGWDKLANDVEIDPPTEMNPDRVKAAQVATMEELDLVAKFFAKQCEVTDDGRVLPATEKTDALLVRLQNAAIAYSATVRDGMKLGVVGNICRCQRCSWLRLHAIGYGNCPPGCDPVYVTCAFINFLRVIKMLFPAVSAISIPVVVEFAKKAGVNPQTPFSHN